MNTDPILIVSAMRTPIGNFQGCFASLKATELGCFAIQSAVKQASLAPELIHSVIMGCVLPAGLRQAPARQASIHAGIPVSTGCTTINKMCGSGMKAVMFAHDALLAGSVDVILAGGMESMTNAPYLLPGARQGYRLGHHQVIDHMFYDGLEDAYDRGKSMGVFAEACAKKYKFDREAQDAFALTSYERAKAATENGDFANEITPVPVKTRKAETIISTDEGPASLDPKKIPNLKPAFEKDGTVTAANASSISDGAAALILTKESNAKSLGATPLAKVIAHSTHSQEANWFTTAPIGAIKKLLDKTKWSIDDVDLFEINEAFAVVTLAAMQELNIPHEKVNVNGGACVLGHPIGASGARILVTLIHALRARKLKRGIAALCIGGGEATAVAIEIM